MPQTFQVCRCYKCEVFQVHPTKKSNKWKCKLCGEKQSFKRFYALGTGKECRLQVQKLNGIRCEIHAAQEHSDTSIISNVSQSSGHSEQNEVSPCSIDKKSKWMKFVDIMTKENSETKEKHMSDKNMQLNNSEFVSELPRKFPRKCLAIDSTILNETDIELGNAGDGSLSNSVSPSFMKDMGTNKSNSTKANITNPEKNVPSHAIVKNSKWSIYVDDTQNSQEANNTEQIIHTNNQYKTMFQFLEDENIDSVLDL